MANKQHLKIIKQGVEVWNEWRKQFPQVTPNFKDADLAGMDLMEADLKRAKLMGANLKGANLNGAQLWKADLSKANLSGIETKLVHANLSEASLKGADLRRTEIQWSILEGADLSGSKTRLSEASLMGTDLTRANLTGASARKIKINDARARYGKFIGMDLREAHLWGSDFREADFNSSDLRRASIRHTNLNHSSLAKAKLDGCKIYGLSVWGLKGVETARQHDLRYGNPQDPVLDSALTTDNVEAAQILTLLLRQDKIGPLLDSIAAKCVLLLGRFVTRQKRLLKRIRQELRRIGYVPLIFDFKEPSEHDLIETVLTLAGFSSFVIADVTRPRSVPLELQAIVPNYMTPVVPILKAGSSTFSMLPELQGKYEWVLPTMTYMDEDELIENIEKVIVPLAQSKRRELRPRRITARSRQPIYLGK